jgi:hypothetical protein
MFLHSGQVWMSVKWLGMEVLSCNVDKLKILFCSCLHSLVSHNPVNFVLFTLAINMCGVVLQFLFIILYVVTGKAMKQLCFKNIQKHLVTY